MKDSIRKSINLTDLLNIVSPFVTMSQVKVNYFYLSEYVDVDYKEGISRELCIKSVCIMRDTDVPYELYKLCTGESIKSGIEVLLSGTNIILKKDFLEFLILNCIENNILAKADYRVIIDSRLGSMLCYEWSVVEWGVIDKTQYLVKYYFSKKMTKGWSKLQVSFKINKNKFRGKSFSFNLTGRLIKNNKNNQKEDLNESKIILLNTWSVNYESKNK